MYHLIFTEKQITYYFILLIPGGKMHECKKHLLVKRFREGKEKRKLSLMEKALLLERIFF